MNEQPAPMPPPVQPAALPAGQLGGAFVSQDEKTLAIVMHVFGLIGLPILGPLIIWIMKKDQSPYLDAQGRELLNFQLSYLIYFIAAFLLLIVLVGLVLLPVLSIAWLVLTIVGLVNAADGKLYRFPVIIRML